MQRGDRRQGRRQGRGGRQQLSRHQVCLALQVAHGQDGRQGRQDRHVRGGGQGRCGFQAPCQGREDPGRRSLRLRGSGRRHVREGRRQRSHEAPRREPQSPARGLPHGVYQGREHHQRRNHQGVRLAAPARNRGGVRHQDVRGYHGVQARPRDLREGHQRPRRPHPREEQRQLHPPPPQDRQPPRRQGVRRHHRVAHRRNQGI
mmetsp:Transcript_6268/g.15236  ORF Transcript_6268/g.15236 Transcript_6268/m.15236 type:complete len:203 (-) Transcript_6268:1171-1779(-)